MYSFFLPLQQIHLSFKVKSSEKAEVAVYFLIAIVDDLVVVSF